MYVPDLQTIRSFLAVYGLRNVTCAVECHNIAVSAVTKRLRDLELLYGVRLFERQSRGFSPTLPGVRIDRKTETAQR